MVNIAMKSRSFRVFAIYAPNDQTERCSYFRQLEPFFGDWNAILGPKLDRGRGDSGEGVIIAWST